MKKTAMMILAVLVCATDVAVADMLEVKGKGFLNGKVLEQNDEEIHFKDGKGNVQVFAKADVTYLELQEDKPVSVHLSNDLKEKAEQALKVVAKAPKLLKEKTDELTKNIVGSASKPLDRSGVDAKSGALASALEEASQASAAVNKKILKVNQEIRTQEQEGFGDSSVKKSGDYRDEYDATKGHFGKL